MQQLFLNVINAILGIWRFRWTALIVTWAVALLGWLAVELLPHKYSSQAKLFVDTNQVLEPLLRDITVQLNDIQRVSLMSRALLTRPNIEIVAAKSGLDQAEDIEGIEDLDGLYRGLESELKLYQPGRDQSLYAIEYSHEDPQMAKKVVESLVEIFISSSEDVEQVDEAEAQRFLDASIAGYEQRLIEAEARLTVFKRENAGSMPTEAGVFYQRLQQAKVNLRSAELELREATYRRDELDRQLEKESVVTYRTGSATKKRIAALKADREELLERYTALHPRAQQLQSTIDELNQQLRTEQAQPRQVVGSSTRGEAYQKLRPIVAEAHATVAELKIRVEDYGDQVDELNANVESIPQVEADLKKLDRDYETIKEQYETLLAKRESAQLSILERGTDASKIQIIEPAVAALRPSSPNKPVFHVGVLLLALGAGVGIAVLMSIFKPVYFDQRTLQMQTGLPVFGSVTMHRSAEALKNRRMANIAYTAAVMMLPVFMVLLVLINLGAGSSA